MRPGSKRSIVESLVVTFLEKVCESRPNCDQRANAGRDCLSDRLWCGHGLQGSYYISCLKYNEFQDARVQGSFLGLVVGRATHWYASPPIGYRLASLRLEKYLNLADLA